MKEQKVRKNRALSKKSPALGGEVQATVAPHTEDEAQEASDGTGRDSNPPPSQTSDIQLRGCKCHQANEQMAVSKYAFESLHDILIQK